ncbi:hypothetical protein P154DRAFT_461715 [Amniculicola lignicola CBS 123094]|uniref:DNA-directed DNA polymerase n=1 Tax=Amniculicola lignicola CBS 123094 TaxID=1392246 RepID=A0A6A5WLH9_9PLEO|nr:hypothetical protein P154DRAFT_461715 [Amniculicola lignicola CBS 123094]
MSDKELAAKIAYFKDQELLDISDDDTGFPDEGYEKAQRAFADFKAMPPPRLLRQNSSFLGPTPKERKAEFEAYTAQQRESLRAVNHPLQRSATAPEPAVTKSFSSAIPNQRPSSSNLAETGKRRRLKHTASLPDLVSANADNNIPFYRRMGVVPRAISNAKTAKPVDIKLEPEHKQLLKGKIIYFFPNDDISAARRLRIHKIIQLGAAWVTNWREDITHIMVDDGGHTYSQLLRHLNKAGLPRNVVVVKFEPYVPQCIQFGTLLDPALGRFLIKGAQPPKPTAALEPEVEPELQHSSQVSLKVKPTKKRLQAQTTQKTDSIATEYGFPPLLPPSGTSSNSNEIRIEDSFGAPASSMENFVVSGDSYGADLAEAIRQAKAVSHLPLDDDDSDETSRRPSSSANQDSDSGTDVDSPKPTAKPTKKFLHSGPSTHRSKSFNQSAFQCMQPNANATSQNPNARTIQVLEEMCKYYDQMQDHWRTFAYRRGIATLRKQPTKVGTREEAAELPFIGSRLAEKIEEIVWTDRLRKLDNTRDDPTDQVLRLFLGIYGVGLSQASKWIQAGHRTLGDLVAKVKLTESQKVGIEHYDDFATRIPRAEVEAHGAFVQTALCKNDSAFEATVMGSYRRGAKDSGDIDLIITKPGASISELRKVVFDTLVPQLYKVGFLKVSLATSHRHDEGTKWHGASCLPKSKTWRRLDLLLVPEEEMGAALLYFTGNDIFNRSLRLLASKKGMRLNQRGLYKDVMRGKNREKLSAGILVEGRSEKRIFEMLGVPWREAWERIC